MPLQKVEKPTCLKAAWELIELFYADKLSQAWLPERLVDWLAVNITFCLHFAFLGINLFRIYTLSSHGNNLYLMAGL